MSDAPNPVVELVKAAPQELYQPVMTIETALVRRQTIVDFVAKIMVKDQDFGVIPGTNSKPVLLKPGAEKLCNFFGLEPRFDPIEEVMDLTGQQHGEPFYYIRYRCTLTRNGVVMGVGEGSCNSWESKYRYREAQRVCPTCNAQAIIKGKEEYGGGWLCWKKRGGCGTQYGDNDPRITSQPSGRVPNPDVADQVNTIQKMAQKRALVPATLLATSGSEFFTQDFEDNQPSDQQNTPAQQEELAKRRIAETAQPEPELAAELQSLIDLSNKPAGRKQSLEFMLRHFSEHTDGGEVYRNMVASAQAKGHTLRQLLIDMWAQLERWKAEAEPVQGSLV